MRNMFRGYYRPTEVEFAQRWKEATFIYDANVLLNLYRFTEPSRNNLLKVLESLGDRCWVPYQVAYEYHQNRANALFSHMKSYTEIRKIVKKAEVQVHEIVDDAADSLQKQFHRSSHHECTSLFQRAKTALEESKANLFQDIEQLLEEEENKQHPNYGNDPILDAVTALLSGRVGPAFAEKDYPDRLKEAKARFEKEIPPGFKDNSKPGDRKYGDVILWLQVLEFAKSHDKPIILVTDDRKEDW